MTTRIGMRFTPRVEHDRMVTAYCDALGLAASGDTEAGAIETLRNTVRSYASALRRHGSLESALEESGIIWWSELVELECGQQEIVLDAQVIEPKVET